MKTKYILHGGSAQKDNPENDEFFKEILKDTPNEVKILLVHFASDPEKSASNNQIDSSQFNKIKGNKKLIFEEADENNFVKQINKNDVIYFGGGTTPKLLDSLKKYPNIKDLFADKIIAGESAGANFLSVYCYSKRGGGIIKGMGIVPVKVICHYIGEHKREIDIVGGNVETLLLADYQYKVFNIER